MLRVAVMSLLEEELTDEVVTAVRPYLDHPMLSRHARLLLLRHQVADQKLLTPNDRQWMAVESLAALLEDGEEPVVTEDLPEEGWQVAEEVLSLSSAWKIDHPQLLLVLDAVEAGHPRKKIRSEARKAARKARMAGRTD